MKLLFRPPWLGPLWLTTEGQLMWVPICFKASHEPSSFCRGELFLTWESAGSLLLGKREGAAGTFGRLSPGCAATTMW